MSYATLMVYVNVDHASKALVGVAADLADKFSAKWRGCWTPGSRGGPTVRGPRGDSAAGHVA